MTDDNWAKRKDGWQGLGAPEYMTLAAALMVVKEAFQETPYLVGSANETRDYRDIDVRVIMNNDKFDALFGSWNGMKPFQTLVTIAVSAWLTRVTGLPVDFQVQRRSGVKKSDWDKVREPLQIYCGEDAWPAWQTGE